MCMSVFTYCFDIYDTLHVLLVKMTTKSVENPHEEQQKTLLNRIVSNVVSIRDIDAVLYQTSFLNTIISIKKKLNDVLEDMNCRIMEINEYNRDIVVLSQFWANYSRNATFNLESMHKLRDPM
ncbi:7199_t:CDS:2 [Cetraspora pellucida]|uniref:DASH complex subunit DAD4 n=1 Tax=Cetraspora pellucida TaxID=1433469 RepID=A0A9N9I3M7_9GLOM|nr:7199_t:CDS:2 [Cetraspora pellucida]